MQIKATSGSGAAGLGIIGTGLALALPEVKWIGWALVFLGLIVFAFDVRIERGHVAVGSPDSLKQRLALWWPQYLMVTSGILFVAGIIAFLQMSGSPPAKEMATTSQLEPKIDGPLISTIGKTFFRCPLPPIPTDRTAEQISSDLKERIQAARDAFGVSILVSELENGRKITMEPITQEAKSRLWGMTRWTLEMRKSGPDLLVTSIIDVPDPVGSVLKIMPVDPKSDQAKFEHKYIEGMFNISSSKCEML
jgi:hypothetical protein